MRFYRVTLSESPTCPREINPKRLYMGPLYGLPTLETTKLMKSKVQVLTWLIPHASQVLWFTTMARRAPGSRSDLYSSAVQMSDIWAP